MNKKYNRSDLDLVILHEALGNSIEMLQYKVDADIITEQQKRNFEEEYKKQQAIITNIVETVSTIEYQKQLDAELNGVLLKIEDANGNTYYKTLAASDVSYCEEFSHNTDISMVEVLQLFIEYTDHNLIDYYYLSEGN